MRYLVYSRGCPESSHNTERAAIKRAVYVDNGERLTTVVAEETSGSHRSRTQVWPARGETRTS